MSGEQLQLAKPRKPRRCCGFFDCVSRPIIAVTNVAVTGVTSLADGLVRADRYVWSLVRSGLLGVFPDAVPPPVRFVTPLIFTAVVFPSVLKLWSPSLGSTMRMTAILAFPLVAIRIAAPLFQRHESRFVRLLSVAIGHPVTRLMCALPYALALMPPPVFLLSLAGVGAVNMLFPNISRECYLRFPITLLFSLNRIFAHDSLFSERSGLNTSFESRVILAYLTAGFDEAVIGAHLGGREAGDPARVFGEVDILEDERLTAQLTDRFQHNPG